MTESATSYTASLDASTLVFSSVQTEAPEVTQYSSSHAGLIIGILLTIISLLIGAIIYVVFQVSNAMLSSIPLFKVWILREGKGDLLELTRVLCVFSFFFAFNFVSFEFWFFLCVFGWNHGTMTPKKCTIEPKFHGSTQNVLGGTMELWNPNV